MKEVIDSIKVKQKRLHIGKANSFVCRKDVIMIEIIKQGSKNRVECSNCGALLSYTKEDIKEKEEFLGQRDSYIQKYIICPQCNDRIVLNSQR